MLSFLKAIRKMSWVLMTQKLKSVSFVSKVIASETVFSVKNGLKEKDSGTLIKKIE
jgi:hypothetical protein